LDNQPLCHIVPELYDICECKDVMVKIVLEENAQLSFRRWLHEGLLRKWAQWAVGKIPTREKNTPMGTQRNTHTH
jgi:hypothetical protein